MEREQGKTAQCRGDNKQREEIIIKEEGEEGGKENEQVKKKRIYTKAQEVRGKNNDIETK